MSYEYSEDGLVETATQQVLEELGWKVVYAWKNETLGEDGLPGRETKSEVILRRYLLAALKRYNKDLPEIVSCPEIGLRLLVNLNQINYGQET